MNTLPSLSPRFVARLPAHGHCGAAASVPMLDERSTRLAWVFHDYRTGVALIRRGRIPPVPLQIEIHPYHGSQPQGCNNRCVWCTRLEDKCALKTGAIRGLELESLLALLRSLKGRGVRRIVLSGNSTEPLLYPGIGEVIETIHSIGLPWVLFSNFYYGETILDTAPGQALPGSTIRVSLDAFSECSYDRTHRPQTGAGTFAKVKANVERLASRRAEQRSPLRIGIAYLMVEANSEAEELWDVICWADQLGLDFLRFSVPLQPTHQNGEFALAEEAAEAIRARATAVMDRYRRTRTARLDLSIRQDAVQQPAKPFVRCHHGKAIPVVGVRGKIYPCTSTSIADFDGLGLGDINDPDFDFWQIWRDPTKWQHDTARCPDCTRFEYDFNAAVEEQMNGGLRLAGRNPTCYPSGQHESPSRPECSRVELPA